MTEPLMPAEDIAAIAASDEMLDRVAAGVGPDADDRVVDLLGAWRAELAAARPAAPRGSPSAPARLRWSHGRRQVAGVAAALVTLAASTGVAAAASGPRGPFGELNRVLFGGSAAEPRVDRTAALVRSLLDGVDLAVRQAQAAGGITATQRAALGDTLDRAAALLAGDLHAPAGLGARLDDLRRRLGALPGLPAPAAAPTAVASPDRHGGSGSDDSGVTDGSHDGGGSTDTSGSGDGSGGSDDQASPQPTASSGDDGGGSGSGGSSDGGSTPTPTSSDGGGDGGH